MDQSDIDTAVRESAFAMVRTVTPALSSLSDWLMAGLGGGLAVLVSNLSEVSRLVQPTFLVTTMLLAVTSISLGLVSRFISTHLKGRLEAILGLEETLVRHARKFDLKARAEFFERFIESFANCYLPILKKRALRHYDKAKKGGFLPAATRLVRASQVHSLLVVAQSVLLILSVLALSIGVYV